MKQTWQDHVAAAAAFWRTCEVQRMHRATEIVLELLEWQVPLVFTGYDID